MKQLMSIVMYTVVLSVVPTQMALRAETGPNSRKLEDVVGEVLRKSGSTAGLEVIAGCDAKEPRVSTPLARNTEESLNGLMRSEKALSWSKGPDSTYRTLIRYSADVPLSSIRIPAKHIEAQTVLLAADTLLSDPSVQAELGKLGYSRSPEEIGFSPIRAQTRTIDLPADTLGNDLMALAAKFGPSVWELDQRACGKMRTFRINWISR